MRKVYRGRLLDNERAYAEGLVCVGKAAARTLTHARVLLKVDEGHGAPGWQHDEVMAALDVSRSTVEWKRCVEGGVDAALHPRPTRSAGLRKLAGVREAHLIAVASSSAPEGRKRWTLRLLATRLVELEAISLRNRAPHAKKTRSRRG